MYQLRFYQDDIPPVLNNGFQDIGPQFGYNYIIGAPNDPHWHPYPKNNFFSQKDYSPTNYAFTDYIYDADHYVYYAPDNSGPTSVYSFLLRNHFKQYTDSIYDIKKRENMRIQKINDEINKAKVKEIKEYIKQYKEDLKKIEAELKTATGARDRDVRKKVSDISRVKKDGTDSSLTKKEKRIARDKYMSQLRSKIEDEYDKFDQDNLTRKSYLSTYATAEVIKRNIESLEKELKTYTN
tara:strand:+ start:767 stop:1480 length:714 start_codon:yes stop_codon:yes gene_type:complete